MVRPHIVVTLTNPERAPNPELARLKNDRYTEAVERAGGQVLPVDETTPPDELRVALDGMDGLLITGGGDLDPAIYGEKPDGAKPPDPGRDAVDLEAFRAASSRAVPVLGICRGMQAINAFSGGSLVQHVEGHESLPRPQGPATQHPVQVLPGSRLSSIIGGEDSLVVNSYHHQAVTADRLAQGLRASALSVHEPVELVEALESRDPARWLLGIQCHPERTESSPVVLERLWAAFLAAAAGNRSSAAVAPG